MSDSTWLLLQLCVAGWTGLLMWGVVRLVATMWNGLVHVRRVHADRSRRRIQGAAANDLPSRQLRPRTRPAQFAKIKNGACAKLALYRLDVRRFASAPRKRKLQLSAGPRQRPQVTMNTGGTSFVAKQP
jgi:hypothetical protein